MGNIQDHYNDLKEILSETTTKIFDNKHSNIDKIIYNEYLRLNGLNDYIVREVNEEINLKFLMKNIVSEETKLSRFKKWYLMAYGKNKFVNKQIKIRKSKLLNELEYSSFSQQISTSIQSPSKSSLQKILCTENSEIEDFDRAGKYLINHGEIGLNKFYNKSFSKLNERVLKGPPELFRWISWVVVLGLPENRNEEFYQHYLNKPTNPEYETQIKKDLNRTLKIEGIENYLISLYNVLIAYSNFDKNVGYCQGMNFIASFILMVSGFNEVDSFYFLVMVFNQKIIENYGIRGFFTNEFPVLNYFVYQFHYFFAKFLPKISEYLKNIEIPDEIWISKWFQTLFTNILPLNLLIRFWDCLLVKGESFVYSFSISVIRTCLDKIENSTDFLEISQILNDYISNIRDNDIESLISLSLEIKICQDEILKSRKIYELKNNFSFDNFKNNQEYNYEYFHNFRNKRSSFRNINNNKKSLTFSPIKEKSRVFEDFQINFKTMDLDSIKSEGYESNHSKIDCECNADVSEDSIEIKKSLTLNYKTSPTKSITIKESV